MNKDEQDKIDGVIAKAWADADFKRRLLADATTMLKAAGVQPPVGYEFTTMIVSGVNDQEIAIQIAMHPINKPYYYGKVIHTASKP